MSVRNWLVLVVLFLFAAALPAQNPEPPKSTAQVGQLIPGPFPSYNINGARAQNVHCLVIQHNLNPVVMVVGKGIDAKNPGDPLKTLLTKLEAMAAENKAAKFGTFAIFLNLEKKIVPDDGTLDVPDLKNKNVDFEARIADLEGLAESLKLKELVLGLEGSECKPAAAYGIGKDDQLNVIVYKRHKVEARFTFSKDKPMTDADVAKIMEAAQKVLPEKK